MFKVIKSGIFADELAEVWNLYILYNVLICKSRANKKKGVTNYDNRI
jgi:hypothetical protein